MVAMVDAKLRFKYGIVTVLIIGLPIQLVMSAINILVIDDRTSGDFSASSGNVWKQVTDGVMGGISKAKLLPDKIENRACLHLSGEVSLENNGGFIQMALDLPDAIVENAGRYKGIFLEVYGNTEQYNVHLKTGDITLPWQSYRVSFQAQSLWQTLYLPFEEFKPHRIDKALDIRSLKRIGIVAIGRAFNADLCVAKVGFYSE